MSLCTCVEDDYRCEWCTLRLRLAEVANERDEARAEVERLERERNEMRQWGVDNTNAAIREGDRLQQVASALRAEVERLTKLTEQMGAELADRYDAKAEVERLKAELVVAIDAGVAEHKLANSAIERAWDSGARAADLEGAHEKRRALESLRERCAAAAFDMAVANTGPITTDAIEAAVRAVPLEEP